MNNKIEYFLPTYEEAKAICEKYDYFQFYENVNWIGKYKICTFNYRLIGYNDFLYPLGKDSHINSFELRGLTFIFNEDGSLFKRYLLMNKFFNLNQVEETQYNKIKHIPIKYVHDKADGSVINFFKIPTGEVYAKSKMSHDNIQALEAIKIYNTLPEIKKVVDWALEKDIVPIFEYVSPFNRIVLKYKETELILLKFRDNITGEYYDLDIYPDLVNLKCAKILLYKTWDEIFPLIDTTKDLEGFVVTLENGMMIKQKLKWYCDLHHTLTESINREDFLIEKAVKEELDDICSLVEPTDFEILKLIDNVGEVVNNYLLITVKKLEVMLEDFKKNWNSNKKNWVLNYGKRDKYFSYLLAVCDGKQEILDVVKNDLLENTKKLQQAREFIKKGDF